MNRSDGTRDLLKEQIDYYRARAREYDEWFLRQGRYDRGEDHRKRWQEELALVESALIAELPQDGEVLELACGTGLWTNCLARRAARVVAVDSSPEALAISRKKVRSPSIGFVEADIFNWNPPRRYDFIFFGFWLSHVPEDCFEIFWDLVDRALSPGGRVFFVDSLFNRESTARDHGEIGHSGVAERKLNDGSTYRIVKRFFEPEELIGRLRQMDWEGTISSTGGFFFYGSVKKVEEKRRNGQS